VLCAGTSDLPVAEEAAVTLGFIHFSCPVVKAQGTFLVELAGVPVNRIYDVGVAGIHRLLRNQEAIQKGDVVIVVAGMDGALPGVVVRWINLCMLKIHNEWQPCKFISGGINKQTDCSCSD